MVIYKKRVIISIGIIISALVFFNCSESDKRGSTSTEVVNSTKDSLNLKESLEKRFAKTYNEQIVTFNDGTTMDISKPLHFDSIKEVSHSFFVGDNIEPIDSLETDSNGVATVKGEYHPTEIGKVALKAINNYKKTKSEAAKKVFLDQMKWAEENFYETDNYVFWYFQAPAPLYHLEVGWTSAFSQGLLLNASLEAYRLTGDERYTKLIEKALKAYMVPVEYGGFLRHWDEGELWFEEYGTERPSRVLNGTIYGLEGVYNVYRDLNSQLALKIFESGVNTIKNHLEDYDAKYTSRYSLADWKDEVSLEHYHEGHVLQLLWLYKITGEEIFRKYAKIFLENDRNTFIVGSMFRILKPKIAHISASHTIDSINHSTKNLNDEIWAYGNFWSSHKTTELIVDFGEFKKEVSGLTLYHVNAKSKDVNFKLYAYDEDINEWRYVQQFTPKYIKDKVAAYNITGKFETYIEHYKIFENADARKVKVIFDASPDSIIAIREINFIYDRSSDIEYLIKKVDERFKVN